MTTGRKFTSRKILVASGNSGKVKEIAALLRPFGIEAVPVGHFNLTEPEESGNSFIENAEIKAKYYGDATGLPAIADDSGLCVMALNGQPGIYSARWAGETKDFTIAMHKIENAMKEHQDKSAYFACALALYWPEDCHMESVEGAVYGTLTFPPRGGFGFGYDPIFIANSHSQTFGEIQPEEKHRISHRADAFRKLLARCF